MTSDQGADVLIYHTTVRLFAEQRRREYEARAATRRVTRKPGAVPQLVAPRVQRRTGTALGAS
ncbi:MAG TPA: hypothetical protein VHM94_10685 [Acidimicrobiia bacterium]|nr:hypothetical protein [Acidimicrobiia bacterium]